MKSSERDQSSVDMIRFRIHLGGDVQGGLDALSKAIERALATKQS